MSMKQACAAIVALAFWILVLDRPASGQAQESADWQAFGPAGSFVQLFTPGDGAILAQSATDQLFVSVDGGASFEAVSLPPPAGSGTPRVLEVDPTNASVIYAVGDGGLYRTVNGGASYTLILPERVVGLSVSPLEPSRLYAAGVGPGENRLRLFRSDDRGATFSLLDDQVSQNPLCVFGLSLLRADESDPERVFRSASCIAGRDQASPTFSRPLERSDDRGLTFSVVARPRGGFSSELVGGAAGTSRYYLSDFKPFFAAPSSLYRSDDDAESFAEVFQLPTSSGQQPADGTGALPVIGALAYNPSAPETVFIGLRNGASGVLVSRDGGQTVERLGRPDIGNVLDLALSADRQDLYAATDQGILRYARRPAASPPPSGPAATPTSTVLPTPAVGK